MATIRLKPGETCVVVAQDPKLEIGGGPVMPGGPDKPVDPGLRHRPWAGLPAPDPPDRAAAAGDPAHPSGRSRVRRRRGPWLSAANTPDRAAASHSGKAGDQVGTEDRLDAGYGLGRRGRSERGHTGSDAFEEVTSRDLAARAPLFSGPLFPCTDAARALDASGGPRQAPPPWRLP